MVTYGGMAKQPVTVPVVSFNVLMCIYGVVLWLSSCYFCVLVIRVFLFSRT